MVAGSIHACVWPLSQPVAIYRAKTADMGMLFYSVECLFSRVSFFLK
jgi:hypothetical protein